MDIDKKLRWSRRLGVVPRWPVVPTIQKQTVAEHSFHVARICQWLLPRHQLYYASAPDSRLFRLSVLEYALDHDDDEAASGDRPGPTKPKRRYDNLEPYKLLVKTADVLEAMIFIRTEQLLGNSMVQEILEERMQVLTEVVHYFDFQPGMAVGPTNLWNSCFNAITSSHPAMEQP